MYVQFEENDKKTILKPNVIRRIAHLDNMLTAIITFENGPMAEPDPIHSHPHEQISYVAEGELFFFINDEKHKLQKGDIFLVPSNLPHTVQTISKKVVLVDNFCPVREDFL